MKPIEIPERFTGTVHVLMNVEIDSCLYGIITVADRDYSKNGHYIHLGSAEIDVPLKRQDEVAGQQIQRLLSEKQRIIDRATYQAQQIDEHIQSLLAIEHKESGDETT